jgi:hypothetical protein|tara:strand:+ start:12 stop:374 length:363 start_codon:yes stop_codon:yes gene_type:complete
MNNRGYISKTKEACNGNINGYLYALVDIEKNNGNVYSFSDDENYHLNNDISYIGITNNPFARLNNHRCKGKGKRIGMVIFGEPEDAMTGKMMEAKAIYDYCKIKGDAPLHQKGHDTWAGA